MARFCTQCGNQIDDAATFCSRCGQAVPGAAPVAGGVASSSSGLTDNVAGMLAYFTIIPAIIFLVMEPYNRNKFIRFHSFQSLFFFVGWFVIQIALNIILPWVLWPLWSLIGLAIFVLWIVLVVKAYGGQKWKLPVIGDLAEKNA